MVSKHVHKFILIFLLIFNISTFAQKQSLSIKNNYTGKEKLIKENKRIQIKTEANTKLKGRFKILNDKQILIKNDSINIIDIIKIRRDPIFTHIFLKFGLIYIGAASITIGLVFNAFGAATAISGSTLLTVGGGLISLGSLSSLILPSKRIENGWQLKIVPSH